MEAARRLAQSRRLVEALVGPAPRPMVEAVAAQTTTQTMALPAPEPSLKATQVE